MRKHILYLASGNSQRFGENKLLYEFNGKPLFQHGLDMLWDLVTEHPDCTLTVVSRYREIREFAESYHMGDTYTCKTAPTGNDIEVSKNFINTDKVNLEKRILSVDSPDSEKGISYTIKAGLNALTTIRKIEAKDFILFVVADQPFIKKESLDQILACAKPGTETASMIYDGTPGNPGLFSASLIPELLELTGDQGGRKVMRNHACIFVEAISEEEFQDFDTKDDLEKLSNRTEKSI